jgi:hypothetical protein
MANQAPGQQNVVVCNIFIALAPRAGLFAAQWSLLVGGIEKSNKFYLSAF